MFAPAESSAGVFFGGATGAHDLQGDVLLLFEATPEPSVVQVNIVDTSQLSFHPFELAGRTMETQSINVVSQDIRLHLDDPEPNVSGIFTMKFDGLLDGAIRAPLFNEIDMIATFAPGTGQWSDIRTSGRFVLEPVRCIPTLSEWGLILLALLMATGGTIVFSRRRSAQP